MQIKNVISSICKKIVMLGLLTVLVISATTKIAIARATDYTDFSATDKINGAIFDATTYVTLNTDCTFWYNRVNNCLIDKKSLVTLRRTTGFMSCDYDSHWEWYSTAKKDDGQFVVIFDAYYGIKISGQPVGFQVHTDYSQYRVKYDGSHRCVRDGSKTATGWW